MGSDSVHICIVPGLLCVPSWSTQFLMSYWFASKLEHGVVSSEVCACRRWPAECWRSRVRRGAPLVPAPLSSLWWSLSRRMTGNHSTRPRLCTGALQYQGHIMFPSLLCYFSLILLQQNTAQWAILCAKRIVSSLKTWEPDNMNNRLIISKGEWLN